MPRPIDYLHKVEDAGVFEKRSNSQWKQLAKQGAITFFVDDADCEVVDDTIELKLRVVVKDLFVYITPPYWIKVGKREWVKMEYEGLKTWEVSDTIPNS